MLTAVCLKDTIYRDRKKEPTIPRKKQQHFNNTEMKMRWSCWEKAMPPHFGTLNQGTREKGFYIRTMVSNFSILSFFITES